MKISIIYYSKTGHSAKLAEAIAKELGSSALNVMDTPKVDGTDLLIVVSGIYGGKSAPELINYLNGLNPATIKQAVMVTSSLGASETQGQVRETLEKKGIRLSPESYHCKGNFLFFGLGHPNRAEIAGAGDFVKRLLENLA